MGWNGHASFSIRLVPQTYVYEVDIPEVFQLKEAIVQNESPRCVRYVIKADISESWLPSLLARGYQQQQRSLWVMEGLLMYLTPEEVHNLLRTISQVAVKESLLIADFLNEKAWKNNTH